MDHDIDSDCWCEPQTIHVPPRRSHRIGCPIYDRHNDRWGTVVWDADGTISAFFTRTDVRDITESRYGPPGHDASYWLFPHPEVDRLREGLTFVAHYPEGWKGQARSVSEYLDELLTAPK